MGNRPYGRIVLGDEENILDGYRALADMPVDEERCQKNWTPGEQETTIGKTVSVTGPGTYFGRAQRTLRFVPAADGGWRFDRQDHPDSMPITVSAENIWTTVRNIVLSSGSPHNYMRMVEHIVALRNGMGIDNVLIKMDSGDPPLFDRSSMDLVEAFDEAGVVELDRKATFLTVKEPMSAVADNGSFLTFLPAENGSKTLTIDCAIDFKTAIGRQRAVIDVTPETFRHGAAARTNCSLLMMLYCKTIGKLFADVRNLGYTTRNILIAGPRRYFNKPGLMHNGKSLEAVWHRACLDLLAAIALIDRGRFCGKVVSYKAGHALDCNMIKELCTRDLLTEM